jgi:hypothetical protein
LLFLLIEYKNKDVSLWEAVMPRRLIADHPAAPARLRTLGALRALWRYFIGAPLDRLPRHGLSSHLLRDIGLSGQSTGDWEEPWKRLK